MIEQVSNSVKFLAFYTSNKQGKTSLTVTVDVYAPSGTQIVTDAAATAIGGGLYAYTLSSNNSTEGEYAAIFKTTDTTVDAQHIPSLWVLGRAGIENLDAATSSRFPSASYTAPDNTSIAAIKANIPTATQIRQEIDANSTKLDVAVSTRLAPSGTLATVTNLTNAPASVTPADIWGYSSRTLTSGAAPSASDNATAVWSAATRTLTSASGPTAAQIRTEIDSNSTQLAAIKTKTDNLPAAPAAVSNIPTAAQIRQELDANSTKLDVAVSTRANPANIPTADIAAIKAKTDALNTDRLQQTATTAIVGALIAQANS